MTTQCIVCGRWLSYREMTDGPASYYFEPDNHFGPERSEWTCARCVRDCMSDPAKNNIWIQPGTRLHMLTYHNGVWRVWTATNSRIGDSNNWQGTYLELHPCGKCVQQYTSETEVRSIVIREGDSNG